MPAAAAIAVGLPPPQLSAALTRVQLAPLVCSWLTSFSGFKSRRSDKVPPYTFASPLLVGRIAGCQSKPTFSLSLSSSLALSLSLVHRPSATSRRSEEAPTLRLTARSGALQAPVRPCNCRQLAATWHGASGERRCRTRTCLAFELGVADTDMREGVCVVVVP